MTPLTDPLLCEELVASYFPDFDATAFFSNPRNYVQVEGDNVGLAEEKAPGVYWIHTVFNSARGRKAINLAKAMIDQLYEDRQFKAVVGLVPIENKAAKFVNRQIGLKSQGVIETELGPCEMFVLTKESK